MKKLFDKEHIWTTLSAIVGFTLLALVVFGIITNDEKQVIKEAWDSLMAVIPGGDWTVIIGAILILIQQVILIFTKDPKVGK